MEDDPRWILLGVRQSPYDAEPWESIDHKMWFCLLVHGAEEVGIPSP